MKQKPKITARRPIQHTGIFNIEEMDLEFSNGEKRCYQRIVGAEQGAVLIVPLLDPDTVLLIKEYSAGTERYELVFPKGNIEEDEPLLDAANREIQEEIGYGAKELEHVTSVSLAPGYLRHTTHIVLARNLHPSTLPGDEPEPLEVIPVKIADIPQLLEHEDFTEARSIAALLIIRDKLRGQ
ncbi:ADP compounds hydrolase NudE [Solemya velesiana gill symbiont]|uniref:ADP compounds hydrolase NudE n=1 Tax=Solemya velesiana gill symbiont TaxID=1918948 RepID=A0A1T2KW91_9GAMM|nr:ADP compounds hydrolase NudE [Solemya velesiana gill symbiont]OOZ37127.1 ADP compounds hydrolase NudE [Solemya velesiana gill symbiont]